MSYIRRHGKRRWRDSGAIAWQLCRALSPINKPYVLRKHLGVTYLLDMHLAFMDHRHEGEEESLRSLTSRTHTSLLLPFAIAELTRGEAISSFLRESPDYIHVNCLTTGNLQISISFQRSARKHGVKTDVVRSHMCYSHMICTTRRRIEAMSLIQKHTKFARIK